MPVSSAAISQVMAGELMLETSHHLPHSNITDWTCQWHFYRIWMERRLLFLLVSQNPMISGVIVVWWVWHFLTSLSLSLYLLVPHLIHPVAKYCSQTRMNSFWFWKCPHVNRSQKCSIFCWYSLYIPKAMIDSQYSYHSVGKSNIKGGLPSA